MAVLVFAPELANEDPGDVSGLFGDVAPESARTTYLGHAFSLGLMNGMGNALLNPANLHLPYGSRERDSSPGEEGYRPLIGRAGHHALRQRGDVRA